MIIVLVLVGRGAWGVHQKASIARTEHEEAERMLLELQNRTTGLEGSLQTLKSQQGMEAEIRQKFSVAKAGEELVVIVDETNKKGENASTQEEEQSFWGMIKGIF